MDSDSSATPVQSPKCPAADLSNLPTSSLPTSPPDTLNLNEDAARREHTAEIQAPTRKRHKSSKRHISPPPLEPRSTSGALGDTSCTDPGSEDVVEGRQTFMRGLSHLSDSLLRKAYISKVATKKTILHRIALSQANIEALKRRNEFFRGLKGEATAELTMNDEELDCIKNALEGRGINEADIKIKGKSKQKNYSSDFL